MWFHSFDSFVRVSVQWHWPGAVRAPPLSRPRGPPALPGLPEHAAGPGRPHGPLGLSPWSPGSAAPVGHQQRLFGGGCSAGGQAQVRAQDTRCSNLCRTQSWASTSHLRFQHQKDFNEFLEEAAHCNWVNHTEFLIWALNTVTLWASWWFWCSHSCVNASVRVSAIDFHICRNMQYLILPRCLYTVENSTF